MEFNRAYNRDEFLSFLRVNFLPEDFRQEISNVENPVQFQYTKQVTRLGECESLGLVVYEVCHSSKHDARVGLTKEAFRLLADEFCERALVFFVPEDDNNNYRFSLIEITLDQSESSSRISRRYSNPHRYSYYLGKGIAYYTPNKYLNEYGRVVSVEDLRNRFSVDVLTKAFYQELSDWYAWAIMVVRFPNDLKTLEDNQKYNSEAMIRLITRLIFVWFLKQRHLVPDEFFDEQFIANELIQGFTPHAESTLFGKSYDSKYYKGVLQNLFFAMLNSPITPEGKDTISERRFRNGRGDYDNNKLMRHEDLFINPDKFVELANKYVPFLNGGLFDCLDDKDKGIYIDAFTDRKVISDQLVIPDFLFFGDEVGKNIDLSEWYGDKKKKRVSALGIIDILKRYNFTVEENTPFDQEVSLDPELLGKVFENLLASYNPETQTTARKQTGSFYTPREIVQYMVDESLIAHLKRTVGEKLEPEYRKLVQYTDEGLVLTDDQKRQIMQSLYECKVLDPACGSGAFPMGMLQQMVHILGQLDPNNEQWKEMMLNNAISETSDAYHNATDEERAEIVADIERSFNESINRPDYARKLYLIENCIYGVDIQPIAIQISKLRFFISLVVDQKTNNNPVDNFGIRPLPNLEAKFVAANTLIGLEKREANLFDSDAIREKEKELKEAKHRIFGAKTVKTKRKYKERVAILRTEIASMLNESGSIGNAEAQQLSSWDMFDQNSTSPFFDPAWMFGVSNGFDVVIGNPPYIQLQANNRQLAKLYHDKGFITFFGSGDIYCLFFEKANQLLSDGGILSFINPNTWLQSITFGNFREYLSSHFSWNRFLITDKVFEATVDTHCVVFIKSGWQSDCLIFRKCKNNIQYLHTIDKSRITKTSACINIEANPSKAVLADRILNCNKRFSEYYTIFNGVKPFEKGKGNPPQTKKTMEEKPFVKEGIKPGKEWLPLLRGSLMNRYANLWNNNYWILYGEWLAAPRNPAIFETKEKIIVRQTGDSIIATLIGSNIICRDNLHICISNTNVSPKFVLGVLNSKLMNFIYGYINPERGEALAQVKKNHVEQLPIAIGDENAIKNLVDEILNKKEEDPQADTSSLENEIDKKVYHLYGLTYDEVLIVDPNTPVTREEYEKDYCI